MISVKVDGLSDLANRLKELDVEMQTTDSEAGNSLIRTRWASIKTFLQTFFDAIYAKKGLIDSSLLTMPTGKLLGRASASTGAVEYFAMGGGARLANNTLFPVVDRYVDLLAVLSTATGGSGNYTVGTNWIARDACSVSGARVLWSPAYAVNLRVELFSVVSGTLTSLANVTGSVAAGPITVEMSFSSPVALAAGAVIYLMVYDTSGTWYTARSTTTPDAFPTTPTYRIGALLLTNMSGWWAGGTAPSSVDSVSTGIEIYPIEPIVSA